MMGLDTFAEPGYRLQSLGHTTLMPADALWRVHAQRGLNELLLPYEHRENH